ncbi:hypothetical protein INS49_010491 [Diaporthe citri]|uniref:uncharacterized protein n=1 Tax=Diaporthe citri TaxID=83186 RepID=UPI001C7EB4D2|nr:uncharacterized protein INS49_010491 [Diaporthe citri]KAG6362261.1 hypothetical protein INS49_010491 [Diaporthe citri]
MARFKVIIVGGGLAGSLLANGLVNNGVDVIVYERDAADSKREGYQIRLGGPAYTGFEACLADDHRAAVLSKLGQTSGEVNTAPSIVNSRFETILDMSQFPSYSKSAAINRVVLRNTLLDPIIALGRVRFGKKLVSYEIVADKKGNEHVEVHFSDGSVDNCDVLVGADGSGSKINHQLGLRNLVEIDTEVGLLHKGDLTSMYLPAAANQAPENANGTRYDLENGSFFWGMGLSRSLVPYENLSDIPDKMKFILGLVKDWAPEL